MPIHKIVATVRARNAIAAFMVALAAGSYGFYDSRDKTVEINGQKVDVPVVMAAELIVKNWEGLVLTAHWDRYGKVWDICYGATRINGKPVRPGMTLTVEQCQAELMVQLQNDYYEPIVACAPPLKEAPDSVQASMTSGAYNFGVGSQARKRGWCGWSMSRAIRNRDWRGACEAQTNINSAGGVRLDGLVNRREMGDKYRLGEAELCVSGLKG
ncbi:Lysozyme RrrD [Hartmannibacter diazotrophicus]|uniref:Lysozyme n=1 Tax=Hartmannibacter diazotrophicus TaxID=1482074 RepID=A0A2C9D2B2_9HYPH|nr:glycoside hydrolase family protein [Hartmannibacter diazotrophicus]SON54288.1 Lysozyme RrrD [Hartmannibacter diazotrophicus]